MVGHKPPQPASGIHQRVFRLTGIDAGQPNQLADARRRSQKASPRHESAADLSLTVVGDAVGFQGRRLSFYRK